MRKQLVQTVESVMSQDERVLLLLGDIGVFGFRNAFKFFPLRTYNVGILEQSTIGMAAGLAMENFIPIVHTIAPFLVERSYEQLKNDFCYQQLGGNFISVGASYDYAALGCTHHCPGDVGILKNIPEMEIILPGTGEEFDKLFRQTYNNGHPTYYRLSERENDISHEVNFGQAEIIQKGDKATVIAVGPALKLATEVCQNADVTLLYYTTIKPFDGKTLADNCASGKVLLCEPYYFGALSVDILRALYPRPAVVDFVGVPDKFLTHYGLAVEQDQFIGFTVENIREKLNKLIRLL